MGGLSLLLMAGQQSVAPGDVDADPVTLDARPHTDPGLPGTTNMKPHRAALPDPRASYPLPAQPNLEPPPEGASRREQQPPGGSAELPWSGGVNACGHPPVRPHALSFITKPEPVLGQTLVSSSSLRYAPTLWLGMF